MLFLLCVVLEGFSTGTQLHHCMPRHFNLQNIPNKTIFNSLSTIDFQGFDGWLDGPITWSLTKGTTWIEEEFIIVKDNVIPLIILELP